MTGLVPIYYRSLLREATREAYPTLREMYVELARPTPRPRPVPAKRVVSRLMLLAADQGEAAHPLKGKGSR